MQRQLNLLIRADAYEAIGTGHVMRCIALGQAWKASGGNVLFVSHCENDVLRRRFSEEGFNFASLRTPFPDFGDLDTTMSILDDIRSNGKRENTIVVLDGYHFDEDYQQKIKGEGFKLLCIDDYGHAGRYYADFILNQNLSAEMNLYPNHSPNTRFLLGPRYALLRKEFIGWKNWVRTIPGIAKKILVTMGGTDKDNVTLKVLRALNQASIPDLEVAVILGPANQHRSEIEHTLKTSSYIGKPLLSVNNMSEIMAWADIAIAAGGSTSWELLFMGLPSFLIVLAENQRLVSEGLESAGVCINLGWYDKVDLHALANIVESIMADQAARETMSNKGRSLVNGEGCDEVVRFLIDSHITFRQACEDDCSLIWKWANDPETRSASFSSTPIGWEHHNQWFSKKLKDSVHVFFILLNSDDEPVGQVRYAIEDREAIVSMSIAPEFRGRGYGSQGIWITAQELFRLKDIDVIRAYIKPNNLKSIRAFTGAGFKKDKSVVEESHSNNGLTLSINKEDILL